MWALLNAGEEGAGEPTAGIPPVAENDQNVESADEMVDETSDRLFKQRLCNCLLGRWLALCG